jgi:glucuronate isomerase
MLRDQLFKEIIRLPVIDVHSHLHRDRICAPAVEEIALYHMLRYHYRAAGMSEKLLFSYHKPAAAEEMFGQIERCWPKMENTGFAWMLKLILRDLYDFDGPIGLKTLPKLRDNFAKKNADPGWGKTIMERMNVKRILSSQIKVKPLAPGQWDANIRFTIEDTPFSGNQEFHTWQERLAGIGKDGGMTIHSAQDFRTCMHTFFKKHDWSGKSALVAWVGSSADFTPVTDAAINQIIASIHKGETISPAEHCALEALYIRGLAEVAREHPRMFQLVYGIQVQTPGAGHHVEKSLPSFANTLGYLLGEFPDVHFNILNGCEADEPVLASLCTAYNNVSLAGYWWQAFYPSVLHDGWYRRLDKVPAGCLCGFFSDGWCIEWTYGRLRLVQRTLANVLAEKIERGFLTEENAVDLARRILFESPRRIFMADEDLDAGLRASAAQKKAPAAKPKRKTR